MNEYLEDIVNRIAEQITSLEGRDRKRKVQDQFHFLHGVEHLLIQLWKGTKKHSERNPPIPYTSPSAFVGFRGNK